MSTFSFGIGAISIHAPARGATPSLMYFFTVLTISIHAPARGATLLFANNPTYLQNFNPRSREGSDDSCIIPIHIGLSFQSTLPRGERLVSLMAHARFFNFNPRSREGSDILNANTVTKFMDISIHAPARGATNLTDEQIDNLIEFQSTLPRGERRVL